MRIGPLLVAAAGSGLCTALIHLATGPDTILSSMLHGLVVGVVYACGHVEGGRREQ